MFLTIPYLVLGLATFTTAATTVPPLTLSVPSATVNPITTTRTSVSSIAATATDITGDIGFSFVNKPLPIPNLPPHVNLTCANCTTHGTLELAAGGYQNNDSLISIPFELEESGFLEFVAHKVSANITLQLALQPGFSTTGFKIPIYYAHLFTVKAGSAGNFDIGFDVSIPLTLTLDSEVDIYPSLTLDIPDNSKIYLDIAHFNRSYTTGFNETKIVPSLNINAPNLAFSLATGLELTLIASASIDGLGGNASAVLDLPKVVMSVAELHNVNGTCDQPKGGEQVFDNAVRINYTAGTDLELSGGLAGLDDLSGSLEVFNYNFSLPSSCLRFDPKASALVPAVTPSASGAPGSDKKANGSPHVAPQVGACIVGLIAFIAGVALL